MLYVQHSKRRDLYGVSREGSPRFLKRIGRRGLNGHKNTRIGLTSNGMRFSRVMRHRPSLEGIQRSGLLVKLGRKRYIIRIAYKHDIKGRSGGCFKGR
jgi:hypothetical protein